MLDADSPTPPHLVSRVFQAALAINACFVALHVVVTNFVPSDTLKRWAHLNGEANPAAWYSGALLLLIGVTAALAALQLRQRDARTPWRLYLLVAAGFVYLSADEVGMIHETFTALVHRRLEMSDGLLSEKRFVGLATFLGYLAIATVLLIWMRHDVAKALHDRRGRLWIFGGAIAYIFGAVVIDVLVGLTVFEYWLEEFLELTGIAMIWCGLLTRLGPRLAIEFSPAPAPPKEPRVREPALRR